MADPAAGKVEFPGGHIEDGETSRQAAVREWQEETGCLLPAGGTWSGGWVTPDGIYEGLVYTIDSESQIAIAERGQVVDPDGDSFEAIFWIDPADLPGNPMVRAELAASIDLVHAALAPVDAPIAKASAWEAHPVRHVEEALVDSHADPIAAAVAGSITEGQVRAMVAAFVKTNPDA